MRKFAIVVCIAALCFTVAACQGNPEQEPVSPTDIIIEPSPYFENGFTEENIRAYYTDQDIELAYVQIYYDDTYKNTYQALVAFAESDWFVFETIDIGANRKKVCENYWLPDKAEFMAIDGFRMIINTFWDDGGPYNDDEFPTYLEFGTLYSDYRETKLPYKAPLSESYTMGRDHHVSLTAVRFTTAGIDIEFGEPVDNAGGYKAGGPKYAQTNFSFDKESHTGTLRLKNTELGTAYTGLVNENEENSPVKSFTIKEDGEDLIITLNLHEEVKYYSVEYGMSLMFDGFYSVAFSRIDW